MNRLTAYLTVYRHDMVQRRWRANRIQIGISRNHRWIRAVSSAGCAEMYDGAATTISCNLRCPLASMYDASTIASARLSCALL